MEGVFHLVRDQWLSGIDQGKDVALFKVGDETIRHGVEALFLPLARHLKTCLG